MAKFPEQKELEFQELAAYVSFFATAVLGISEESPLHPSHFATPVRGKISKSKLLAGLKQATRDTLEVTKNYSTEKIEALDSACKKCQVLTLSAVRERYGRQ